MYPVGLAVLISWGCGEVLQGFALPSAHLSRDTSAGKKHHALLSHFYPLAWEFHAHGNRSRMGMTVSAWLEKVCPPTEGTRLTLPN